MILVIHTISVEELNNASFILKQFRIVFVFFKALESECLLSVPPVTAFKLHDIEREVSGIRTPRL